MNRFSGRPAARYRRFTGLSDRDRATLGSHVGMLGPTWARAVSGQRPVAIVVASVGYVRRGVNRIAHAAVRTVANVASSVERVPTPQHDVRDAKRGTDKSGMRNFPISRTDESRRRQRGRSRWARLFFGPALQVAALALFAAQSKHPPISRAVLSALAAAAIAFGSMSIFRKVLEEPPKQPLTGWLPADLAILRSLVIGAAGVGAIAVAILVWAAIRSGTLERSVLVSIGVPLGCALAAGLAAGATRRGHLA